MSKNKKIKILIERCAYAYIRKIKKWMYCPACQKGKMNIDKNSIMWLCEECGYKLSADEFEEKYVFWFCDECRTYLNNQEGFDIKSEKHICTNCGYENDTTFNNVKGICTDCGNIISDLDRILCVDCKQVRKEKAKQWLIATSKVVGAVAVIAGTEYLTSQFAEEDVDTTHTFLEDNEDDDSEIYGLGEGIYPYCKTCGTKMTNFDGWAWYTCPKCEDKVRIVDGKEAWYDDIFKSGKRELCSDFELANFCHGGDLTED